MAVKTSFLVFFLVFLAGGLVGLVAGGYIGGHYGMGLVINNVTDRDARDVNSMVDVLRELKAGNNSQAADSIESMVNDRVILMDPEQPYPGISEVTVERVNTAFKTVAEYRKAYPRSSPLATDKMVDAALKNRGL